MNRLLVTSRTQPNTDLPKYHWMSELSVVLLSLFSLVGLLYCLKIKRQIQQKFEIFRQPKRTEEEEEFSSSATEVIVIDDMAIVNNIKISNSQISN